MIMPPPCKISIDGQFLTQHPPTSAVVKIIMKNYIATLAEQSMVLPKHHIDLLTDFLATLVVCDNLSDTILDPADLLTTSTPRSLHVGTGLSVTREIASAIADAKHSVLFSTCYWADSASRDLIADALRDLANNSLQGHKKVVVRIGFSSSATSQKLFHTSSTKGKVHPPSTWSTIGLPDEEELSSLDMSVKSLFFLPFSVVHSKFCIIDGRMLFLPSSNISWETWLEQCTIFTGHIVNVFAEFWEKIWGDPEAPLQHPLDPFAGDVGYPTIFLPSPHHRNPSFSPTILSSSSPPPPPPTPQNTFLMHSISQARNTIYLQTPNLTSQPLLRALEAALARGVNVEVVTCRRMMVAEQVLTTGGSASTEGGVRALIKHDDRLRAGKGYVSREKHRTVKGVLGVWYYSGPATAAVPAYTHGEAGVSFLVSEMASASDKSHVKALIIDGEITVLGSANGDRASWYTSQEVNAAVLSASFAAATRKALIRGLGGRLERVVGVSELREDTLTVKRVNSTARSEVD